MKIKLTIHQDLNFQGQGEYAGETWTNHIPKQVVEATIHESAKGLKPGELYIRQVTGGTVTISCVSLGHRHSIPVECIEKNYSFQNRIGGTLGKTVTHPDKQTTYRLGFYAYKLMKERAIHHRNQHGELEYTFELLDFPFEPVIVPLSYVYYKDHPVLLAKHGELEERTYFFPESA